MLYERAVGVNHPVHALPASAVACRLPTWTNARTSDRRWVLEQDPFLLDGTASRSSIPLKFAGHQCTRNHTLQPTSVRPPLSAFAQEFPPHLSGCSRQPVQFGSSWVIASQHLVMYFAEKSIPRRCAIGTPPESNMGNRR
jgi:hypothetical protein